MRSFSTAVTTAINAQRFKYFFLIELTFGSTSYYFTSYNRDITWPSTNSNTYTSDGGLFEFDTPNFSSVLDREAYKVVITDISDQFANHFKSGVIGSPINVKVGIVDPSTDQPLTGDDDIMHLYSGFVDSPSIENDWDRKIAVIEGTSPMADLDQVNITMVSKDGMDQIDGTDTSFDSLYEDSEINIKWGKV